MATKTISLRIEAYERLKRARRSATESFSDVVMRATWPESTATAGEFLALARDRGPLYGEAELDALSASDQTDQPPPDKWTDE